MTNKNDEENAPDEKSGPAKDSNDSAAATTDNLEDPSRRLLFKRATLGGGGALLGGGLLPVLLGSDSIVGSGSVAWDGLVIPPDSVLFFDQGRHNGPTSETTLTDTTKSWVVDEWIGFRVRNTSDGSETALGFPATDSDTTSVTTNLVGGNGNDWDDGDYYEIVLDVDTGDLINYEANTDLGGMVAMSAKGVPVITGASGFHSFDVWITDITDSSSSANYTVTVTV